MHSQYVLVKFLSSSCELDLMFAMEENLNWDIPILVKPLLVTTGYALWLLGHKPWQFLVFVQSISNAVGKPGPKNLVISALIIVHLKPSKAKPFTIFKSSNGANSTRVSRNLLLQEQIYMVRYCCCKQWNKSSSREKCTGKVTPSKNPVEQSHVFRPSFPICAGDEKSLFHYFRQGPKLLENISRSSYSQEDNSDLEKPREGKRMATHALQKPFKRPCHVPPSNCPKRSSHLSS